MRVLVAVCLVLGMVGCPDGLSPPTQATVTPPDAESVAVEALGKLEAVITRNEHGDVIDVSFYNARITDSELSHLTDLPDLEAVSLKYNPKITDAGLVHLKELANLRSLSLMSHAFSDEGLVHLQGLSNLQTLNIRPPKPR
jgi:hypothetical protein